MKKSINYQSYQKIERAREKDKAMYENSLNGWIDSCHDYSEKADRYARIANSLLALGILLGGLIVETLMLSLYVC